MKFESVRGVRRPTLMSTLSYVSVPGCATRLASKDIKKPPKLKTALPHETQSHAKQSTAGATSSAFNLLPQILLSSSLPSNPNPTNEDGYNPRRKKQKQPIVLISNKDPLSIQITTVNFKRFVERVGPVFWLQDRIEEVVLWKTGWKRTAMCLAVYAFLCCFPRLVFLLPHVILVGVILSTAVVSKAKPTPPAVVFKAENDGKAEKSETIAEDSVDWQANIQAIQNLMGL